MRIIKRIDQLACIPLNALLRLFILKIACIPPCIHTARCAADFSMWPFDTQNCSLHIGTWINSADDVDLKVAKTVIPESDLQSQDQLWKMLATTYTRNHGNFSATAKS